MRVDKERLILEHREAALNIAKSFLRRWSFRIDPEELRSVTDLALCEAAKGYRGPARSKFTTYLYLYIKGELIKMIKREIKAEPAIDLLELDNNPGGSKLQPLVAENSESDPADCLHRKEIGLRLQGAFKRLDLLEKEIIFRLYVNESKVSAVAKEVGYSRGHVSELRGKAMNKMRRTLGDLKEAA